MLPLAMETHQKWYKKTPGIAVLIVLFFPVGLFLMWKYARWNIAVKGLVTGFFVLVVLGGIVGNGSESTKSSTGMTQPSPTPTVVLPQEKINIVVTSQIVKKVNGKFRYFFDIRNKDTKPFEGSVTISLFTKELNNPIAGDTFNTSQAIEPELGTSVYADANTGTTRVHGAEGIVRYKYTVKRGNNIVSSGEDNITDKFEDTDSFGL